MFGREKVKVKGTVVACDEEWGSVNDHPKTSVVLDVQTTEGGLVRVSFKQQITRHNLSNPEPGDVVDVDWDAKKQEAQLLLAGDPRYDRKVARNAEKEAFGAAAAAPAGTPAPGSSAPGPDQNLAELERRRAVEAGEPPEEPPGRR